MAERRYTLYEITAAMGAAFQTVLAAPLTVDPATEKVYVDRRAFREFIDLTVEELKALPPTLGEAYLSPND